MSLRGLLSGVLLSLCAGLGLTSQSWAQPANPQPPAAASDYVLGPGDVVEAQVLGRSDFSARGRIGADGSFQLPFVGSIAAANKTATELSVDIGKALEAGGYFAHPIVKVEIVSYASRYVIVLGSVGAPGLVPVDRAYRLSEILARVGGVKDSGADYVVIRPENGPEKRIAVSDLATGDMALDPVVSPGEKIYVPPADVFYISGQVKAPGAYPVASGMTLRMAIARGGGLTDEGTDRGVRVTHKGGAPQKPGLDAPIASGDVIVVGERLF
jgi:polysaccharide export outer membrane protein